MTMATDFPVLLRYESGGLFRAPNAFWATRCDRQFVVGEIRPMAVYEDRSYASHDHQFAWLTEAWRNLPEDLAELYPSPEHLRKRALIQCGYYDETIVDAGTRAAALRVAAAFRAREEFSWIVVRGPLVVIRTAKSQSRRSMAKGEFQESKTAIMELIAGLIGVSVDDLQKARAA
jgi:hypothetical protein